MSYQNFLIDAIDAVLGWDVSDAALGDAVLSQACFMAGSNPESEFSLE